MWHSLINLHKIYFLYCLPILCFYLPVYLICLCEFRSKNKTKNFSNELYSSGTYCNSASACFVASDGKNLRLYQAVVDARKLLDELSDPETSVSEHCYTLGKARQKVCGRDSTAHLCFHLETSGRSVQHSQPAIHCQTWMYHRVGCHHKPG